MKLPILSTTALAFSILASAITVSYDVGYDDGNRSMTAVSCSDGQNGLMTRYGWQRQRHIPNFPNIGGFQDISWNSDKCGNCYSLTYNGKTIYVVAIDHAATGFNIGKRAMDNLTNGNAEQFGRVDAQFSQAALLNCKL